MPSAVAHFVVGASLALPLPSLPRIRVAVRPAGVAISAGLIAAISDLDTVFFSLIPYDHFFGHRGFFHSPFFALLVALILSTILFATARATHSPAWLVLTLIFFLAGASHGVLDDMTDAGLGVMLLYPLSEQRLFFSWRPFYAPPVVLSTVTVDKLVTVLRSEWILVIVAPSLAAALAWLIVGLHRRAQISTRNSGSNPVHSLGYPRGLQTTRV